MANNRTPLGLTYDNLVVGSSLEAFLFAWYSKVPVIYTRNRIPYFFEEIPQFGLGTNKLKLWNSIAYQLSIAGHNPFEDKINIIRLEEGNLLKIVTVDSGVYNIKFNKLWVFDDYNFDGLPAHNGKTSDDNLVVDYYHVKSASKSPNTTLFREDRFLNKVIFLDSLQKNCLSSSLITDNDLEKYPEYMSKIKLETLLRNNGITDLKKYPMSITHKRREVMSLGQNIYDDFGDIYFCYTDLVTIDQFARKWFKIDYMKYFRMKMGM